MTQLFTAEHYGAFDPSKTLEDTREIRIERERVRDQFLWIDSSLYPFIQQQGWDLHRHHQKQHWTSSTHFVWINVDTGETSEKDEIGHWKPIVNEIGWLWLHYGKSFDQLNFYKNLPGAYQYNRRDDSDYYNAFYVHTRIQFYLTNTYFGVYLLFTDKNRYDKSEFLRKLRKQPGFKNELWTRILPLLGRGFQYVVGDETLPLLLNLNQDTLIKFIQKSHPEGYSGIQKRYTPHDPILSTESIVEEMKTNLTLLYPLYDLMAVRQSRPLNTNPDLSKLFGGNARVKK